jgi:hypothetical protein
MIPTKEGLHHRQIRDLGLEQRPKRDLLERPARVRPSSRTLRHKISDGVVNWTRLKNACCICDTGGLQKTNGGGYDGGVKEL